MKSEANKQHSLTPHWIKYKSVDLLALCFTDYACAVIMATRRSHQIRLAFLSVEMYVFDNNPK